MKSKSRYVSLWMLGFLTLLCAGCTGAIEDRPPLVVDADFELVFSHRYSELVLVRANGESPAPLVSSETAVIAPRFSPCGEKLAFYDVGTSDLPVSSTRVALAVVWVGGEDEGEKNPEEQAEVRNVSFGLPQFDLDHRLMIDDVIPPLWEPGGESLIVAHGSGIERIALSGKRSNLIEADPVTAVTLSPRGDHIVYSTGVNIFVLDRNGDGQEALLSEGFVPKFGNRSIRAVAVSPDGGEITFGLGREVFVVDVRSKTARKTFEASHGVYWIAYLPGGREIVLLSGKEDRRRGLVSPWMSGTSGEYSLFVAAAEGEFSHELFSAHLIDVRDARPDLSPDGRYVSVAVKDGAVKEIVLVATDGSGVMKLTSHGPNAFASWRPVR